MASFFFSYDKSDRKASANVLNVSQEEYKGADSWEYVDEKTGCCIVSDSRIDYRQELTGELGLRWSEAEGFSDSKLILLAYLKWGEACLSHFYGDFSFVLWDPGRDEVFCARVNFG